MGRDDMPRLRAWSVCLPMFVSACVARQSAAPPPKKKPVVLLPVLGERSPRKAEEAVAPVPAAQEKPIAIVGATLLLGTGERIENGTIVFEKGRITAVGPGAAAPAGATAIDGRGKFVTPGLIDTHSHM